MRKRMGRPEKPASQRRVVIFRFVATRRESVKVRSKAKLLGMTISDYLRSVAIPKEE
jgi:hypothetical protein